MKKLLLSALFSTTLVTCAIANTHQGFYAGLSVGYNNNVYKIKKTLAANGRAGASVNATAGSFLAGLSLAYLHEVSSSFYLGAELAFDFLPQTGKTEIPADPAGDTTIWTLKKKSQFTYSGALLAGVAFEKVLPYLKVGAIGTNVNIKGHRSATAGVYTEGDFKASKRPWGLVAGLGIIFPVADSVYIGTEYAYSHYFRTIKFDDNGAAASKRNFAVKPSSHTFKLKFAYKF